jgi:hypothetical protein
MSMTSFIPSTVSLWNNFDLNKLNLAEYSHSEYVLELNLAEYSPLFIKINDQLP